jgi:hypothetical protein
MRDQPGGRQCGAPVAKGHRRDLVSLPSDGQRDTMTSWQSIRRR